MGAFATGQVILLPFPFSDLSRSKYRPAAILAHAGRGEIKDAERWVEEMV